MTYLILINGKPKGFIRSTRSLGQGDSLSHFLFLFCAEGLNALLNKATEEGEIRGLALCRRSPNITHLFFIDDCLLFCRSKAVKFVKIQQLLDWSKVASGQQVNKDKTTLVFNKNTPEDVHQEIMVLLSVLAIKHYEK